MTRLRHYVKIWLRRPLALRFGRGARFRPETAMACAREYPALRFSRTNGQADSGPGRMVTIQPITSGIEWNVKCFQCAVG